MGLAVKFDQNHSSVISLRESNREANISLADTAFQFSAYISCWLRQSIAAIEVLIPPIGFYEIKA
jgi:hypothetical protein